MWHGQKVKNTCLSDHLPVYSLTRHTLCLVVVTCKGMAFLFILWTCSSQHACYFCRTYLWFYPLNILMYTNPFPALHNAELFMQNMVCYCAFSWFACFGRIGWLTRTLIIKWYQNQNLNFICPVWKPRD